MRQQRFPVCITITSPGVYVQTSNLSSSSTCITIKSSDVTFDGAGYSITGPGSSNYGIYVYNKSTTFTNVTIKNAAVAGWKYGIYYKKAENGSLKGNTASSNYRGIYFYSSSRYNTLTGNTASNNTDCGIYLTSTSSSNTIYNNYFNNTNNAEDRGSNDWNTTKISGTNIIGGPYLGGNSWAKPDGTGFGEACMDADGDGICDSSYTQDLGNVDYLPLSLSFTPPTTTTTTSTTTTTTTTSTTTSTTSTTTTSTTTSTTSTTTTSTTTTTVPTTTTTTTSSTTTTTVPSGGGGDPTEIPEFPTTVIPAIMALGGYMAMRLRRRE